VIESLEAFELGEEPGFAFDEAAKFAATEHQIQWYADVGDEEDDEHPGERVTRLAFLGEEACDEEKGQQEGRDRQEMRNDGVAENVAEKLHSRAGERARWAGFAQAARDHEKVLELAAVTREFPRPFSW